MSGTAEADPIADNGARYLKKGSHLLRQGKRVRFTFITAEKVNFPIYHLCKSMQVSVSGFYAWQGRPESRRSKDTRKLTAHIKASFERSRQTYGSPRIIDDLRDQGIRTSRKRIEKIMKDNGLQVKKRRRWKKTTDSNHNFRVADNKVNQNFAIADEPNKVWGADITYIFTQSGWVYLAVVIDYYSRKVIGYSCDSNMRTGMVSDALKSALKSRKLCRKLIHHSDRGAQYASDEYAQLLRKHKISPSMSRKGNCWDNSMTESFFATLKKDLIYKKTFSNCDEAKSQISEYIDNFYNSERRHSSIGNISPNRFEFLTRFINAA